MKTPPKLVSITSAITASTTARRNLDRFAPINKVPREVMERIRLEDYIEEEF